MESNWLLYMWHAGVPLKIRNNYQTDFEIQSILIVIMSNLDLNKTSMFFDKIHISNHDDQEVDKD